MKKLVYIVWISLLVAMSGCESWLDVSPKSQVKEEDLFTDEAGFRDALTGVYTIMGRSTAYGGNMTMGFIEMLSQTYSTVSVNYGPTLSYNYKDAVASTHINEIWEKLYNAIVNSNYILKNLETNGHVLPEEMRNMVEAEALALRAYLHFDLLRTFAPAYLSGSQQTAIPYLDKVSSSPVSSPTVSTFIDRIINDLEKARSLAEKVDPLVLDDDYSELDYTTSEQLESGGFWLYRKSRLNYYGITALAARVYLYKGNAALALERAQEVIQSGKFELLTDELLSNETNISYVESLARHEYISSLYVYKLKEERADAWFRSTSAACVINAPRKISIFGSLGIDLDPRSKNLFSQPAGESNEYCSKYYTGTQIPLIKLAEMYLIAAEASGDISYLEKLRAHRGYASSPLPADTELSTALRDEYRREFIAEGQLFFYYKRLNMSSIPFGSVSMSDIQYVLPQPDDEIEFGYQSVL